LYGKIKTLRGQTRLNKLIGPIQPNQAHFRSVEHFSLFKKKGNEAYDVSYVVETLVP